MIIIIIIIIIINKNGRGIRTVTSFTSSCRSPVIVS